MSELALIGLGSNLGDRRAILDSAVASLSKTPGMLLRRVSSYHETVPVGGPSGQGNYLNAAVLADVESDAFTLLGQLQSIEETAGRARKERWGERTLDLDLLIFGARFLSTPKLNVPHPKMSVRRFVLGPASEIAPELVHLPTRMSIRSLFNHLDRKPHYVALAGPPNTLKSEVFQRLLRELPSRTVAERPGPAVPDHNFEAPRQGQSPETMSESPVEKRLRQLGHAPKAEFLARLAALSLYRWTPEVMRSQWLVTEDCPLIEFESLQVCYSRPDQELVLNAITPTFAVVVDPDETLRRGPSLIARFPVIWPESKEDALAISNEILAICSSISPA